MAARTLLAALVIVAGALSAGGFVSAAGAFPEASSWGPVGTGVPLDTKLQIVWTMAMDTASVEDAFSLTDGVQVFQGPLVFAWTHTTSAPYGSEATPLFALNSSTTYHATVLSTARDSSGLYPLDQDRDGVGGEVTDALAWDFTTEDATPPRVVSTSPADMAANVSVTTDIVVEFSEAMDKASASKAFSISPEADGVILWDPPGTRLTFSPALNLQYGTLYIATVAGTAEDLSGNFLDGDGDGTGGDAYLFRFTTEPDVAAPRVDAAGPPTGAMSVSVSANVLVRFSETMLRTSVENAVSVTHGATTWTKANGSFTWSGAAFVDDTVVFNPFENLPFAAAVTVTLNASIARDPAGFYLDGDGDGTPEGSPADNVIWSFTTEATDTTSPTVLSAKPPSGSADVPETTNILISFSESMDSTSVEDAFALASAPRTWTKGDGTFAWSQGWDEATYTPSANLAFGTAYTIRFAAGAADVNGNLLDGNGDGAGGDDFASGFTTRAEPDAVPPSVMSTIPADGAAKVTRAPTISITFDDAMNRDETAGAISMAFVTGPLEAPVALGAFDWSAANHTVSFRPAEVLDWDSQYRVSVSQAAKDDAGLRLQTPFSFVFRTDGWSGRVIGVVVAGGLPVPGATVTLGNSTTQTNETGAFEFNGVEAGTYVITFAKDGYETVRLTRELNQWTAAGEGGRVIELGTVSLQRSDLLSPAAAASIVAAVLAALVTIGFLLRRRRRIVQFDELEADEAEAER